MNSHDDLVDDLMRVQALHRAGQFHSAERAYISILIRQPEHAAAWHYLGVLYSQIDRLEDAVLLMGRSLEVNRRDPTFLLNRALLYERRGDVSLARSDFIECARVDPGLPDAFLGLADLSREAHEYLEAAFFYTKALALAPSSAKTWMNLGAAFDSEKRFPEALRCYRNASVIDPEWPDPTLNTALCNLLLGNFEAGWLQYESRWHVKTLLNAVDMTKPLRTSQPLFTAASSGPVLLWAEQGLGDELMFGSLIDDFAQLGHEVIVQCDKRLRPLFERSMPNILFVNRTAVVPESRYTSHLPLGSLPRLLRPSMSSFSRHRGAYLRPDSKRSSALRPHQIRGATVRIGLSWGSARGEARSIPLHDLLASIDRPEAEYVCLQYGEVDEHIERAERLVGIKVHREPTVDVTNDIDGLAALIDTCDLVVSVGNATAHLAGALGKSAIVLLPFHPGWRWLVSGEMSPWYPTLRLLRQGERSNWKPVLRKLRTLLPLTAASSVSRA